MTPAKHKLSNMALFTNLFQKNGDDRLPIEEARLIIGGDPTPAQVSSLLASLTSIFIQANTCSNPLWTQFNNQLALLASTNVGFDLLTQIFENAGGNPISITGINPGLGANGAEYHDNTGGGGSIDLGGLILPSGSPGAWDYTRQFAFNFGAITHEIFHAHSFIMDGRSTNYSTYKTSVGYELDAFLFTTLAATEVDQMNNITDINPTHSYAYWDHNLYDSAISSGVTQASLDAFQGAWYNMFINKQFTQANYNILSQNFLTASAQGHGYGSLSPTILGGTNGWSRNRVNRFYISDFSQSSYYSIRPAFPFRPPHNFPPLEPPPQNPPDSGSGGSGGGNPLDGGYTYVYYNDPGAPGSGGWYWVPGSDQGSGTSSTGGFPSGGGATGPRSWHYAGSLGPVSDDSGVPLTPAEIAALALN